MCNVYAYQQPLIQYVQTVIMCFNFNVWFGVTTECVKLNLEKFVH